MNIIFLGTPPIAVPPLHALINHPQINLQAIITQPDRPIGRRKILTPPPVKQLALQHAIPVFQPESLRKSPDIKSTIKKLAPDFLVVIAYGQILDQKTLDLPTIAPINVHGSLLPAYRGASPIESAIKNGDTNTGISIMKMTVKMDQGPVYHQIKIPLPPNQTTPELRQIMAEITAHNLPDILQKIASNQLQPRPQNENLATYCHKISKSDAQIDFTSLTATQIYNRFRAYKTWPGIHFHHHSKQFQIIDCKPGQTSIPPGQFRISNRQLLAGCARDSLVITAIKPPGKSAMPIQDFLLGNSKLFSS